ncbi:MAG TPA: glycosyltransferase 87 family protein [Thermoleophilaceae bacterium]
MRRIELAVMGVAAAAASVFMAFWPAKVADYAGDAGPSLHALINGDAGAALGHPPAMGWFAIIFRAPVAFFARHGSSLLEYRLGNVPCVLVLAALALWIVAEMQKDNAPFLACAVVLALAILGPMNFHALQDGHPEELLGAALCVAAVLAAASGRSPLAAGVLLGLALATKQWAILAVGPALLAAPRGRLTLGATALAVAGALTAIPALVGPHDVLSQGTTAARATIVAQPDTIWWPLGHIHHISAAGMVVEKSTIPRWLAPLTHPLIAALGVVLPLALFARTRRYIVPRDTALALLALLFLLRCALDPMTIGYYHVPLLVSLLALEALHHRRAPLLTLISSAVMWVLVAHLRWGLEPGKIATVYLAWAIPLGAYLATRIYAPSVINGLGKWLSTSLPSSVTTTRSSIRTPNAPGT